MVSWWELWQLVNKEGIDESLRWGEAKLCLDFGGSLEIDLLICMDLIFQPSVEVYVEHE